MQVAFFFVFLSADWPTKSNQVLMFLIWIWDVPLSSIRRVDYY